MIRFKSKHHFKDHFGETRLFLNRTIWSLIFIFILISVALFRLFYLQVSNHSHYTTLSHDNRVKITAVPPTRGLIYDRNGILLAENRPAYRLEIIPEQVQDLDQLLVKLQQLIRIRERDLEKFKKTYRYKRSFDNIPLRFNLSNEDVARLAAIQHRLPGINITAGLTRHYPSANSLAHVVGYVSRIDERNLQKIDVSNYRGTSHIGKTGIEQYNEDVLHGQVGYQSVETNAQGRVLRVVDRTAPVPGSNLHLTLDSGLQYTAEQAMGDYSGAVVAMDPDTGDILAMVSTPTYNPNSFVNGIGFKEYAEIRKNKSEFNRALFGQYPPGSTYKPFIGLAGLHFNTVNIHYQQYCPGYYILPGEERKFRDWKKYGHGNVTLDDAITESCDVYFYDLAYNLGIDRISSFLEPFGFGSKTGITLYGEKPGLLASREWKKNARGQVWFPGETLNIGIGQGDALTTPLQLAMATARLATRGHRVIPRLVKAIQPSEDTDAIEMPVQKLEPIKGIKAEHWEYITQSMKHVVHAIKGTAHRILSKEYTIAGKTGTAQVFGIKQDEEYDEETVKEKLRDHALFISFAPVKNPTIIIAVIVENGGHGSSVAAPIARKVMDYYFENIPDYTTKPTKNST